MKDEIYFSAAPKRFIPRRWTRAKNNRKKKKKKLYEFTTRPKKPNAFSILLLLLFREKSDPTKRIRWNFSQNMTFRTSRIVFRGGSYAKIGHETLKNRACVCVWAVWAVWFLFMLLIGRATVVIYSAFDPDEFNVNHVTVVALVQTTRNPLVNVGDTWFSNICFRFSWGRFSASPGGPTRRDGPIGRRTSVGPLNADKIYSSLLLNTMYTIRYRRIAYVCRCFVFFFYDKRIVDTRTHNSATTATTTTLGVTAQSFFRGNNSRCTIAYRFIAFLIRFFDKSRL